MLSILEYLLLGAVAMAVVYAIIVGLTKALDQLTNSEDPWK